MESSASRIMGAAGKGGGEGVIKGGLRVHDVMVEEAPTRLELFGWCAYAVASYFVHSFLLPLLFPLFVSQRSSTTAHHSPTTSSCSSSHKDYSALYQMVTERSITVAGTSSSLSPLHWTAISWLLGVLAAPIIPYISRQLDRGHQPLIIASTTVAGVFCCLVTGLFDTIYLFPLYIAAVTVAITAASAAHTRQFSLMTHKRSLVGSRLSLYATAAANLGTVFIAAFTFQMLRRADHLTSLWVVSIFAGLMWAMGIANTFTNRPEAQQLSRSLISDYCPHLVGGLAGVFLSVFSSTCLFASTTLYLVGGLCIKPVILLTIWVVYFAFAAITLPLLYPIQLLMRADASSMTLLGFIMSAFSAGLGFYYKDEHWSSAHVVLVTLVQSTGVGIMSSFGRVMILDRTPIGKESVFSALFEWVKITGAFAGFALVAVYPKNIKVTYGISFLALFVGIIVLVFGNRGRSGEELAGTHRREMSDEVSMIGSNMKANNERTDK